MKKYSATALVMILTAALLTGCRNRNNPMETTLPTVTRPTQATTAPTTEATTPTTRDTQPTETIDHGNGPLETGDPTENTGASDPSDTTENQGRSARPMPRK